MFRFLQNQKAALSTTISNVRTALNILSSRFFNVYLIGVKAKCNISKNLELARPTFSRQITSSNIRCCEVEATGFSRSPPFLTKFSPHDLGLGIVQQCTKMARWRWEVGLGRQMGRLTECYGALALFGSLLPISDLLLKIGECCWNLIIHLSRRLFCLSHSKWTPQSGVQSAIFVSFRATRHDRTPVLLLAGDRQWFAMPRNLAPCVHLFLNTLLLVLHYGIEMSMFLPRDSLRWKKRANFLWDKSVGAIVLPQAR